jgi:hypothetical protein
MNSSAVCTKTLSLSERESNTIDMHIFPADITRHTICTSSFFITNAARHFKQTLDKIQDYIVMVIKNVSFLSFVNNNLIDAPHKLPFSNSSSTTQQKVQSAKLNEIKPKQFCKINTNCPYSDPDKTQTINVSRASLF